MLLEAEKTTPIEVLRRKMGGLSRLFRPPKRWGLNFSPPERLWHFTSLDALDSILKHRTLWASEVECLNDKSEQRHGMQLALKRLGSALDERTSGVGDVNAAHLDERDFLVPFLRGLMERCTSVLNDGGPLKDDSTGTFVVSFCRRERAAGQWLNYGKGGSEVAIELDITALKFAPLDGTSELDWSPLEPVIYRPEPQEDLVRKFLDEWTGAILDMRRDGYVSTGDFLGDACDLAAGMLAFMIVPQMKDPAFKSEEEWRRFASASLKSPEIKVHATSTALRPYVEFELGDALKTVVYGWKLPARSTEMAIKVLLRRYNYVGVDVRRTDVPVSS